MIHSLLIKNYQSHKLTRLKFDKGVNVFIGTSDAGKSSIVRALDLVFNNNPSGDGYRSDWGGETKVRVRTEDHVVKRVKDKTVNSYFSKEIGQEKFVEYKSFGQTVPEDVKAILNSSSLNFQEQHDPSFMLTMSSGEVARYLNKIIHLDVIDRATLSVASGLKKERGDLKYSEEYVERMLEDVKQFDWLLEAEKQLNEIEVVDKQLEQKIGGYDNLVEIITEVITIEDDLKIYSGLDCFEKEVKELEKKQKKVKDLEKKQGRLDAILTGIEEYSKKIKGLDIAIEADTQTLEKLIPDICPLCGRSG